jgi:ArsR family transcriptional regulator, arsenate/arsenite/antimonite-responsive transcriptional repressor / arsenate reductase (thioredoxin)
VAHWSVADPAAEEAGVSAFARTADELYTRIQFLMHVIEDATTN